MTMVQNFANKAIQKVIGAISPLSVAGVVMAIAISPATAESSITIPADRAKVISLNGEASAVVIGNPTYADVTVRGKQLIIHGRHFGSTNLLIMDDEGNMVAAYELHVVKKESSEMVVYKAAQRQSYTCVPKCEVTLSVGDSPAYFNEIVNSQITGKTATATTAAKIAE